MDTAIITPDKFSWARMRQLWDFYYPAIKLPLILYPVVCISLTFLSAYLVESKIGIMVSGLISMIYGLAIYLFPLFFTRYKSPIVEAMLPVTTAERLTYFIGVTLLIPMLLGQVPSLITMEIIKYFKEIKLAIPDMEVELTKFGEHGEFGGFSLLQQLPPLFGCLFVVITCHRNRVGYSIAMVIGVLVVTSIIAAVLSILYFAGYISSGAELSDDALVGEVVNFVTETAWIIGSISILFCIGMMVAAYNRLKRAQI